jgi:hypothetical protein
MVNKQGETKMFTEQLLKDNHLESIERIADVGFIVEASSGKDLMITDAVLDALIAARRQERKQEPAGFLYLLDDDVADSITKYEPHQWVDHTVTNIRPLYED